MKNIPIIGKLLLVMAAFGAFALGVAYYSGSQLQSVDHAYSSMLERESTAALQIVRMNRSMLGARAAIADLLMSRSEAINKSASAEMADMRSRFIDASDKASAAMPELQQLKDLKSKGLQIIDQNCSSAIDQAAKAVAIEDVVASQTTYLSQCQPLFPDFVKQTTAIQDDLIKTAQTKSDDISALSDTIVKTTYAIILAGLVIVVAGAFFAFRAWLIRPIKGLESAMQRLAGGNLSTAIDGIDRKDEVGAMARAVQVFKDNGIKAKQLEAEAEETRRRQEVERERLAAEER
ncbi:HAMP domain-containing protein, partial [Consotaella salsifontis]